MDPFSRSIRIVGVVLACYALLVGTHLGEFWPFSIYPMFSQAGNPWTRALVRTLPPPADDGESVEGNLWDTASLETLPGEAFPLSPEGIFQNDLANYISKTETWNPRRIRGLRGFFRGVLASDPERQLMVMRMRGRLTDDSVSVSATPLALISSDTTRFNPSLDVPVRP